jgi:hypothetical protein
LYTLHSKNMKDYINIGVNGLGPAGAVSPH